MDETGLGQLIALLAIGALLGSLATATILRVTKPARMMVIWLVIWHLLILLLGLFSIPIAASVVITMIGLAQSFAMIPMSVLLLKITDEVYRGRVSGVRMLAVYGMPMGLLTGGALIEWLGIPTTTVIFGLTGILTTLIIVTRWRTILTT